MDVGVDVFTLNSLMASDKSESIDDDDGRLGVIGCCTTFLTGGVDLSAFADRFREFTIINAYDEHYNLYNFLLLNLMQIFVFGIST